MVFLGQNHLYDGISWKSHLSMVFLGLRRLSMAFYGLSVIFMDEKSSVMKKDESESESSAIHQTMWNTQRIVHLCVKTLREIKFTLTAKQEMKRDLGRKGGKGGKRGLKPILAITWDDLRPSTLRSSRWRPGMGEMPKASRLRHAYDHRGPGPRTVVEHALFRCLPNGPRPKGHDRVESTTMLPRNFESAGAVPLVEGNIAREEAMWEPEAREDGPPQL
ncbi:hypothetical protein OsI_18740 [Oryza sativa Indica Group]|uniref:Uncharacterized protein n=1 Tax=Oryza sativa subsp. indica TaxID=39946 RepID=B8AYV9_ORYSI|nr:hypothetical protein OsI_18740 [Oryza sativa Indica Group]